MPGRVLPRSPGAVVGGRGGAESPLQQYANVPHVHSAYHIAAHTRLVVQSTHHHTERDRPFSKVSFNLYASVNSVY